MLCFRKTLVAKKFMDKKGGVSKFSVENFCPKVQKNFVGEAFSLSLNSSIENFYASECYVTIFCRIFLSHIAK